MKIVIQSAIPIVGTHLAPFISDTGFYYFRIEHDLSCLKNVRYKMVKVLKET